MNAISLPNSIQTYNAELYNSEYTTTVELPADIYMIAAAGLLCSFVVNQS